MSPRQTSRPSQSPGVQQEFSARIGCHDPLILHRFPLPNHPLSEGNDGLPSSNPKILLPVNIRRILRIQDGESDLILNLDEATQSVTVETRDQALARIRSRLAKYIPEGAMLSEELLADRREESARE